jgi:hypothetical protein
MYHLVLAVSHSHLHFKVRAGAHPLEGTKLFAARNGHQIMFWQEQLERLVRSDQSRGRFQCIGSSDIELDDWITSEQKILKNPKKYLKNTKKDINKIHRPKKFVFFSSLHAVRLI